MNKSLFQEARDEISILKQQPQKGTYLWIANIPVVFHSKDLRNYFSYFIEKEAFITFNFKHRSEITVTTYLKKIMGDALPLALKIKQNVSKEETMLSNPDFERTLSKGIEDLSKLIELASETKDSANDNHEVTNSINPSSTEGNINATALLKDLEKLNANTSTGISNAEEKMPPPKSVCNGKVPQRNCCLLLIKNEYLDSFTSLYHRKFWVDERGLIVPIRCLVFNLTSVMNLNKILLKRQNKDDNTLGYSTRAEVLFQKQNVMFERIHKTVEFKSLPKFMPQGNIGTPNSFFKALLVQSKLPIMIIRKYGMDMCERPKKKYSRVDMDYETDVEAGGVHPDMTEAIFTASGDLIPGYFDVKFNKSLLQPKKDPRGPILELEQEEEDGAEVEEWDRFIAYHDDVTKQERTKETLFESEIEQVWEKGGPGLVFYTDAQFWRVHDGEEAERETDEWDVDMSPYYGQGAGDLDARESMSMNEMNRLKAGTIQSTVFQGHSRIHRRKPKRENRKPFKFRPGGAASSQQIGDGVNNGIPSEEGALTYKQRKALRRREKKLIQQETKPYIYRPDGTASREQRRGKARRGKPVEEEPLPIGSFEQHTRGIGRRLMESFGWRDGEGLGRERKGIVDAVCSSWKHPFDRTGVGYAGETKNQAPQRNTKKGTPSNTGTSNQVTAIPVVTQERPPAEGRDPSKRLKTHEDPPPPEQQVAAPRERLISTAFDPPGLLDPMPPLIRSSEPTTLSHRQ